MDSETWWKGGKVLQRRWQTSFLAITAVVLVVACGDSAPVSMGNGAYTNHIDVSRAKAYHSLREVAADAELVVRVTATSQRSIDVIKPWPDALGTPFTVTTVNVSSVLKGTTGGRQTLSIRQIGSTATVVDNAPGLLTAGSAYLLFLDQFTYGPGRATEQYVLVGGGAGLFADSGATVSSLDTESPDLPRNATITEIRVSLNS